ncbi:MAG: 16S rRNA (cytidine(1402)-2'-O)-methyltransferase [Alphaproteobacteria bacterium]|nr:16S rRNA (cytidine(1402)-2'-O)-methyltransferase [Alphaproteobacteria bacterium]
MEPTGASRQSKPEPGLYIVPTPIGNLRDITLRALDILQAADLIACEDTRVTGRLLQAYGLETRMTPYHDHNAVRKRPALLRRLADGARVALVSDAGTPLIADPGYRLVQEAVEAGIPVTALPGASAALVALSASGLPTDRFLFLGFLPTRAGQRDRALADVADLRASLIVYESPRRLAASLAAMARALGDREAVVARELTKRFEEIRRGALGTLAGHYAEAGAPRGEVVIVIAPPGAKAAPSDVDCDALLAAALKTHSLRDAASMVSAETGLPRRAVYDRALRLNRQGADTEET